MRCHLLALLCPGAILAPSASAQFNDAPRNNEGDVVFAYSDPSAGAPLGMPPDLQGDLYWTVHPGVDQLAYAHPGGAATMEIAGYYESLYDTDWSTTPWFYTRTHGPALPGALGLSEPSFFQFGLTTETTVVLGPSGFGGPCTIAPSMCSPGVCPSFIVGWIVDIQFGVPPALGSGPSVSALGTSASDLATTWFLHGGMVWGAGFCTTPSDYTLQDAHSTDETPADPSGLGRNPWGGFQIAGGGPSNEGINSTVEGNVTWREPVLNPIADSGFGLGLEDSDNGGGAQNGFMLGVSSGSARLAVELRDEVGAGVPGNLAFAAASLVPVPLPGATVFGAQVLIAPDPLFALTVKAWQGSVSPITFVFTPEGAFESVAFSVPPSIAGASLYLQGLTLDPATFGARTTNRVRVRLF